MSGVFFAVFVAPSFSFQLDPASRASSFVSGRDEAALTLETLWGHKVGGMR